MTNQLGGLVCYQADYNNDGRMDVFIPRGAWLSACDSAEPAPQQRRWNVRRRDQGGRAARSGQLQRGRAGATTTTTAGSTCSSAVSASPIDCITTGATARSRKSSVKAGLHAVGGVSLLQGNHVGRLGQRRLSRPVSQQSRRTGRALSQQSRRDVHERHLAKWASTGPVPRLLVLDLGLRQRRLARHLRHVSRS